MVCANFNDSSGWELNDVKGLKRQEPFEGAIQS
jgi:hypothetical protein